MSRESHEFAESMQFEVPPTTSGLFLPTAVLRQTAAVDDYFFN